MPLQRELECAPSRYVRRKEESLLWRLLENKPQESISRHWHTTSVRNLQTISEGSWINVNSQKIFLISSWKALWKKFLVGKRCPTSIFPNYFIQNSLKYSFHRAVWKVVSLGIFHKYSKCPLNLQNMPSIGDANSCIAIDWSTNTFETRFFVAMLASSCRGSCKSALSIPISCNW